jgi:predicted dithiol-disulfide oxidoreductase (DUF899 family)
MINTATQPKTSNAPAVVSRDEWLVARKQLLAKEKELTRARDALNAERRKLPWVRIDKKYVFDTSEGKKTLADFFEGRSQLIVNHFMLGPGWKEGCVGCSFGADHIEGALVHLEHHDVSYVAVSRAPLDEIQAFNKRMGWKFRWVSSFGSDFNFDYHVSFTPRDIANGRVYYNYDWSEPPGEESAGLSVFYKDDSGQVFHTYSSYGRGNEELLGAYVHLDITPKGRNENGPGFNLTDWVRHHDRYDHGGFVDRTGRYIAIAEIGSWA